MTWREVRNYLNSIKDDSILDMPAGVWLYNDCEYDLGGFNLIVDIRPYDASDEPSEDNELSFTIREL